MILVGDGNILSYAQATSDKPTLTSTEVKRLEKTSPSQDDSLRLVSYYALRQHKYQQRANEERKEWERRSRNITCIAAKYPRPVDSARNLYEYNLLKAAEMESLQAKYLNYAQTGRAELH
jgi:hypothetical protein